MTVSKLFEDLGKSKDMTALDRLIVIEAVATAKEKVRRYGDTFWKDDPTVSMMNRTDVEVDIDYPISYVHAPKFSYRVFFDEGMINVHKYKKDDPAVYESPW